MIYSDKQIFIHMPKTGGTSIRNFLLKELGWNNVPATIGYKAWWHRPYILCPQDIAKDREAIVFIRNPWDFYISYWAYSGNFNTLSDLYKFKEERNITDFRFFLKNLLDGDSKRIYRLPQKIQAPIVQIIKEKEIGLLNIYCAYMTSVDDPRNIFLTGEPFDFDNFYTPVKYYKLENLNKDFFKIFRTTQAQQVSFENLKRQNQSRRDLDYRVYYTPELRQLVAERERYIIKNYNYSF